ncbi:hypothetical protein MTO96_006309 [Rhipicephalus appendiculatus]
MSGADSAASSSTCESANRNGLEMLPEVSIAFLQFRVSLGSAPSSYTSAPGPDAPSLLRLPIHDLDRDDEWRLFRSVFLRERQLQRAQDATSGQHCCLQSHASLGNAPSSYTSAPGPDAPSLLRLPIHDLDRDDEWRLFRSVFLRERQLQRAQYATSGQHCCLQSHASLGSAPSSYTSAPGPDAPSLLRLPIHDLDRDDERRLFRGVFLHLQERQLQLA